MTGGEHDHRRIGNLQTLRDARANLLLLDEQLAMLQYNVEFGPAYEVDPKKASEAIQKIIDEEVKKLKRLEKELDDIPISERSKREDKQHEINKEKRSINGKKEAQKSPSEIGESIEFEEDQLNKHRKELVNPNTPEDEKRRLKTLIELEEAQIDGKTKARKALREAGLI